MLIYRENVNIMQNENIWNTSKYIFYFIMQVFIAVMVVVG